MAVGLQVISLKKLGVDDIVHFDFMEPLEDSADSASEPSQSPSQHSQRCCGVVGVVGVVSTKSITLAFAQQINVGGFGIDAKSLHESESLE